jgi:hypothetical protein
VICVYPTGGGAPSSSQSPPARTLVLVPSSSACRSGGSKREEDLVPPFWLVVRVRFCLLWRVVRMVGVASTRINLPQLYSHISDDLQGSVSEFMATCANRSFRSAAWSSRRSSDLVRSVSWHVAGVRGYPRRRWRARARWFF